ncbi:hypothetical protein HDU98_001773 [Podochytrium sp. JEL0797]|nr:hypothetical protein HDU98_001773 [Podochytrium sp. JEL0797]
MGYDSYVRSVSRQSAEEHKQRQSQLEAQEKRIREDREAAALAVLQEAAQRELEAQQEAEREQRTREWRETLKLKLAMDPEMDPEMEDGVGELPSMRPSVYQSEIGSTRASVSVAPGRTEDPPGSASRRISVATKEISAQNQQILNMAAVFLNKPAPTTPMNAAGRFITQQPILRTASPGDVILGRRGSLHAIPTITKLSQSQMDLFTSTTGQFRGGPRDPHFRFLRRNLKGVKLSGPGISIPTAIAPTYSIQEKKLELKAKNDFLSKHSKRIQGAQAMKEHYWQVSKNKYTVGAGTDGFGDVTGGMRAGSKLNDKEEVNETELRLLKVSDPDKYKKYIEREKAKAFLLTKWEVLEQLRIQIIAKTTSLKHYHSYYEELFKENEELRAKHKEVTYKTNTKISQTLEKNEDLTLDIVRIDQERKKQYQTLKANYNEFEANADQDIESLRQKLAMTEKTVHRINVEINKLMDFKLLKESNPTAIANRIKEVKQLRSEHAKKLAEELLQIKVDWQKDQSEIEAGWMAKVQTLIDAMGDSLKVHVDKGHSGNYHQNARLRHEIAVHRAQQQRSQEQIDKILEERRQIKLEDEKLKDGRRNVFRLKEQMSCTPDMEFEVKPRNYYCL